MQDERAKHHRKKKDELIEEIVALAENVRTLEQALAEHEERLIRAHAEIQNIRRRFDDECERARRSGQEETVFALLQPYELILRAVALVEEVDGVPVEVRDGFRMIVEDMRTAMERIGLEEIETVGLAFDHTCHHAFETIETDEVAAGTILDELRKGFSFHGKVVRPSLVRVATPCSDSTTKRGEIG